MCMSFAPVGRSLKIVSYVAFKISALWYWRMFNCNPPIAHCHPLLWGGGILVDHWSTISSCSLFLRVQLTPAFVQIMSRHRPGYKPFSEPMMVRLLTHICITRPQWVKILTTRAFYILSCFGSDNKITVTTWEFINKNYIHTCCKWFSLQALHNLFDTPLPVQSNDMDKRMLWCWMICIPYQFLFWKNGFINIFVLIN